MDGRESRRKQGIFKRLRDRVSIRSGRLAADAIPKMRLERAQRLALWAGRLASLIPGKRRRRILDHLAIAFPPGEFTEKFRRDLVRPNFEATFQMMIEAVWVSAWVPERDNARVRVVEEENWRRTLELARERGKGLILFTAHLGTVELFGKWIASLTGLPLMAVGARPKIKELEEMMLKVREASGLRLVFRGEAGLATRRHLARGGALIMFVDHNLRGDGVEIPFMGKGAHTLLAPTRLALQSGAVVNTIFGLREGTGRFVIRCDEPMILPNFVRGTEERFRQEAELAQEYTRRIEAKIREYPEQYLWMHKRWQKRSETRPFPS